jgi:hypothetical protein
MVTAPPAGRARDETDGRHGTTYFQVDSRRAVRDTWAAIFIRYDVVLVLQGDGQPADRLATTPATSTCRTLVICGACRLFSVSARLRPAVASVYATAAPTHCERPQGQRCRARYNSCLQTCRWASWSGPTCMP